MCNILKESRWTQDRNTAVVNDWEYKHILLMFDDNLHIVLLSKKVYPKKPPSCRSDNHATYCCTLNNIFSG